ncbi:FTR1 family protein [Bacteriovoracaceae bacterium]|nr:FTR1 family protein [Bacteriovoracaceae bacterium]
MKFIVFNVLVLLSISLYAGKNDNALAVHLLSYIGQDYGEAVENGQVKSNDEYQEQLDFVKEVVRISKTNNYDQDIVANITKLSNGLNNKVEPVEIAKITAELRADILKKFNLLTYPATKINLAKAAELFQAKCISCHGDSGYGDGPEGVGLEPAPTNFHDLDRMTNVSPYGAYNTITLGVNGTGMLAHDDISEEDRWSLAYYVSSFRFNNVKKINKINLDVKESSSLSDNEIKEMYNVDEEEFLGVMASIRDINTRPPSGGGEGQLDLHITKAINDLKKSYTEYNTGNIDTAKNLSLTAYLQGLEPVEGILMATNSSIVTELERDLSKYRSVLSKENASEELKTVLDPIITKLEGILSAPRSQITNSSSMLISFGIVLREAFEAGLILILLLGLTRKAQAKAFNKDIHIGWASSLLAGIILYVILEKYFVITGKLAETISGYTSLFASVMLFYVGYWLHKNTDVTKIKEMLTGAVNTSVGSGKGIALFLIAFTACFREVLETILFLKIIILDGHQSLYVAIGAIGAIVLSIVVISFAVINSIKLNLKYLFKASTFLILTLSTVFLGKGIGALQKTGILGQTNLDIFPVPAIGFNSTAEVLIGQLIVVLFIIVAIVINNKNSKPDKSLS